MEKLERKAKHRYAATDYILIIISAVIGIYTAFYINILWNDGIAIETLLLGISYIIIMIGSYYGTNIYSIWNSIRQSSDDYKSIRNFESEDTSTKYLNEFKKVKIKNKLRLLYLLILLYIFVNPIVSLMLYKYLSTPKISYYDKFNIVTKKNNDIKTYYTPSLEITTLVVPKDVFKTLGNFLLCRVENKISSDARYQIIIPDSIIKSQKYYNIKYILQPNTERQTMLGLVTFHNKKSVFYTNNKYFLEDNKPPAPIDLKTIRCKKDTLEVEWLNVDITDCKSIELLLYEYNNINLVDSTSIIPIINNCTFSNLSLQKYILRIKAVDKFGNSASTDTLIKMY